MGQLLSGKVAIVTGGANGIGRGMVELFAAEGAKVVIADMAEEAGRALATSLGANAAYCRADVSVADDVQALIDFTVGHFGGLHVMVNNAGISGKMEAHFIDDELADFDKVLGVNLLGVMLGTQRAARHMRHHGGGAVINIASIAGITPGLAVATYRAAKAGAIHFSKSAAIDLAQFQVRVNCICPGNIRTTMNSYSGLGLSEEKAAELAKAMDEVQTIHQPLKRYGTPADIANAALYLASEMSAQVTGAVIPVDGGISSGDSVNHFHQIVETRARILAS